MSKLLETKFQIEKKKKFLYLIFGRIFNFFWETEIFWLKIIGLITYQFRTAPKVFDFCALVAICYFASFSSPNFLQISNSFFAF